MKRFFYLIAALALTACSSIGENTDTNVSCDLKTKGEEIIEHNECSCGCSSSCPYCKDECPDNIDHDQSTMPDENNPEPRQCGCSMINSGGGPGGINWEEENPRP
ncbi:MAG: hypothetical protein IK143_04640 [Bacteroidales bacterium]|nr:hypothetical protein [Bacteroidales bacterium]